jgi:hypothetical protein
MIFVRLKRRSMTETLVSIPSEVSPIWESAHEVWLKMGTPWFGLRSARHIRRISAEALSNLKFEILIQIRRLIPCWEIAHIHSNRRIIRPNRNTSQNDRPSAANRKTGHAAVFFYVLHELSFENVLSPSLLSHFPPCQMCQRGEFAFLWQLMDKFDGQFTLVVSLEEIVRQKEICARVPTREQDEHNIYWERSTGMWMNKIRNDRELRHEDANEIENSLGFRQDLCRYFWGWHLILELLFESAWGKSKVCQCNYSDILRRRVVNNQIRHFRKATLMLPDSIIRSGKPEIPREQVHFPHAMDSVGLFPRRLSLFGISHNVLEILHMNGIADFRLFRRSLSSHACRCSKSWHSPTALGLIALGSQSIRSVWFE